MFDDDGEQPPAEKRVPKTRDLAAEITPSAADEAGSDDEGRLEGGLPGGRDDQAEVTVDGETATAFWAAVIYVNVGLLLVALGPMLAVFRGRVQVGAGLLVLGSFALYRAYTVYRGYTAADDTEGDEDDTEAVEEAADEDAESTTDAVEDRSDGD